MLLLAGCNAIGEADATRTVPDDDVPFTFEVPATFTVETVDEANSRGDVLVAAGLSKVDVIAVRRVARVVEGRQHHEVLGHAVTSEVHPVAGEDSLAIECQYTGERADEVRTACREALESVAPTRE